MDDDPRARSTEVPALADGSATTQPGATGTRVGDASEAATLVPASGSGTMVTLPPAGYMLGEAIGRGGMGEVLVAQDLRIGREVAVKRMTASHPDAEQIGRFLREARIQARLEHPAIVPVHELGVDDKGRPFFTMKRLVGKTLGQRQNEGMTLNRLLRAYVEVCLAIEFAHARGVVHRDLKPSNVMLGDYGEVYVIDWGIARVLNDDAHPESAGNQDIGTLDQGTKTGALLGTPGYMAPEQIRGHKASPAADVYALGAILFEILTGEILHKRGEAGIGSTLGNPQQSPATRRPERSIPPELDALCFAALNELPEDRPSAHDLAEKVQAFLDGDRDMERRRQIAADQVRAARDVLTSDSPDARSAAMRRAGRALVLDPQSEEAAELVSSLLLAPPRQLPPDLAKGLDEQERQINRDRSRKAIWVYLSVFILLPLALAVDIKNWSMVISFYGVVIVAALSSYRFAQTGNPSVAVVLVVNMTLAVLFTRIASPFVLTPLMVCCGAIAITAIPWINERTWVVITWITLTVLVPIIAEWLGWLPRTWSIGEGIMLIKSNIVESHGRPTEIALTIGNLIFTFVVGLFALGISRRRRLAQQQLFVQAWHLRQLLPNAKQPWATQPR